MPDVWLPGAYRDPGVNSGYRIGECELVRPLLHCTVGSDSRGIGKSGYMNLLVHQDADRENGCTQYAEINSKTWHSYEPHRSYGPGFEFERRVIGPIRPDGLREFEPLTPNQIEWGKRIVDFMFEWGVPTDLYSGPRYEVGGFHGFVNHHDVDDSRSDGLTRAEWDLLIPNHEEDDDMRSMLIHKPGEMVIWVYDPANGTKTKVKSEKVLNGMKVLAPRTGLIVDGLHNGAHEADPDFVDGLVELT